MIYMSIISFDITVFIFEFENIIIYIQLCIQSTVRIVIYIDYFLIWKDGDGLGDALIEDEMSLNALLNGT